MLKSITTKSITAIAAAAMAASLAVFLTSAVPEAKAASHVSGAQPLAKGDRLSALTRGAACSSRSWPYYDQNCRFDLRKPANDAPTVRIIALR
jgi:hypothetical protein